MSINDLRKNGVCIRGKTIRVSLWDEDELTQELFWEYELSGNCDRAIPEVKTGKRIDELLDMDIAFIYAVDGVLNIEVKGGAQ